MGNGLMVDWKQRAELIDLIEAIRDGRGEENATGLKDARKQLTDLLFYLET
jgi:hypothetical protein